MGLIDLKTDLKSLRYGKDTIGGGYSGQPYIQTPIPDSFNSLGPREDFILRGGANAIGDAVEDVKRLTKMFIDTKSPNGILFFAKQNLLSRTAVRTQTSGVINEGIYTPLSTLAQAGVVNIGGHLNKQGINPFAETGAYANNEALYSVRVKSSQPDNLNRLVTLFNDTKDGNFTTDNFGFRKGTTINPGGNQGGVLLSYIGGPGSTLGVGKTNIQSTFRTGKQNPKSVDISFFTGKNGINYKSVNAENKQVGGLQAETGDGNKPWIKGSIVFDYKGKFYTDTLPSFNLNSPQSSSLNNTWYSGSSTWTPQYTSDPEFQWGNIERYSSEYINPQFFTTYLNARTTGDNRLLEVFGLSPFVRNNILVDIVIPEDQRKLGNEGNFKQLSVDTQNLDPDFGAQQIGGLQVNWLKPWTKSNIYHVPYRKQPEISLGLPGDGGIKGTNVNTPQSQSLSNIPQGRETWTAKQDITNPNGPNYITGKGNPLGTKYAVEESKGVTNKFNNDTNFSVVTTFNNPSVYNPSGSNKPLLSVNNEKIGGTNIANANGAITYNQEDLFTAVPSQNSPEIKEDFRKVLRNKIKNDTVAEGYEKKGSIVPNSYIDYKNQNIGAKNLLGNPGTKVKNLSNFSKGTENTLTRDQINASEPGADLSKSDLIPFKITNLSSGQVLTFRAFLGGITDTYSATINSQQYVGRGEQFYTYGGQTRKISLSWTVAALSKEELLPMYKRLNALAGNTAPKYVDGFMQGPLVKMTIGGYISELPGYIEGFSLDMAEDSTWEIGINPNGSKDSTTSQLTHVIKVSGFNFTPIPNYLPQVGASFISISSPS